MGETRDGLDGMTGWAGVMEQDELTMGLADTMGWAEMATGQDGTLGWAGMVMGTG